MHENHAKVMTLFKEFDRNGDGQLSFAEFHNGCQKLGIPASPDDIKVWMWPLVLFCRAHADLYSNLWHRLTLTTAAPSTTTSSSKVC